MQPHSLKSDAPPSYFKLGHTLLSGILYWALSVCPFARADDSPLLLHYFGTLGMARASSKHVQYVRDLSQPSGTSGGSWFSHPDTLLGLQANYTLNERANAAAQVVSRYRYDGSYHPEIMWAYLNTTTEHGTKLRLGRLVTDFYMLADSRLVGYTNLVVRPSTDFFGQLPLYHIDGLDIAKTFPLYDGLLTAKLFGGYTKEYVPVGRQAWNMGDSPMLGGNLTWHQDAWSFGLGYAQLKVKHDWPFAGELAVLRSLGSQPSAAADSLSIAGKLSRYYSMGVIYDDNPLQVQLMLNSVDQESHAYQNYHSAYFLAGYRLGKITPYTGISRSYSKKKQLDTGLSNPAYDALNARVTYLLDVSHTNQKTYTLGLRWDFSQGMDVKIQWDAIRGKGDALFLYRNDSPGWNGKTDVLSFTMDFAF